VQAILLLDTGASITSITEALAGRLGIDPKSTRAVSMGLADGRMIDIQVTKVDAVGVGSRMKFSFEIAVLPDSGNRQEHDGYLGVDFLRNFPYLVDFQNNLIRWQ
jgi:predicted aspartyl protease